jgi:L-fuconolactonase
MEGEAMAPLRRDYLLSNLRPLMRESGVSGLITVQARQTVRETEWLLELASAHPEIRGVVGWVPLIERSVGADLARFAANPKLRGVRHVLHDETDDDYMLREDFNRGIRELRRFNLRYDLLIFERHLPQTLEFVRHHPDQVFIVDHVAKPRIREGILSPWRERISELGRYPNVYCKISGMVTEAHWTKWQDSDLLPYIETVLEAFGPRRLMFGSDWPVLTLASTYQRWVETFRCAIARLSQDEQSWITERSAMEAYGLERRG